MKLKSQVSLFIIISLVLLLVFGLIAYLDSSLKKQHGPDNPALSIKTFIQSCITEVSEEGIILMGLQNGIIINEHASVGNYKVNYALINNKSIGLSREDMQAQFEEYIAEYLSRCINDFEEFPQYKIKHDKPNVAVQINRQDVSIFVSYNVQAEIGKRQFSFDEFTQTIPVRLSKIQGIVSYVSNISKTEIELYSYLGTQDINTTVYPNEEGMIYVLSDDKSLINNIPYKYVFAMK